VREAFSDLEPTLDRDAAARVLCRDFPRDGHRLVHQLGARHAGADDAQPVQFRRRDLAR
jgi:hypothetical protein